MESLAGELWLQAVIRVICEIGVFSLATTVSCSKGTHVSKAWARLVS